MGATIGVPAELDEKVGHFIREAGLPLTVVVDGSGTVTVFQSEGHQQGDAETLRAGGWISCPDAFAVADKLGIETKHMGKLLDELDVKIKGCQLGCF